MITRFKVVSLTYFFNKILISTKFIVKNGVIVKTIIPIIKAMYNFKSIWYNL